MGYAKRTFKGLLWMSGSKLVSRSISILKIAILAHFLAPAQFGIFGIATLILSLLDILTETGVNIFLIQSEKAIKKYINSAWFVSIIRGCFISILIIVLAPFIANFFHISSAVNILYFISIVPFIRGFINPAEIQFQKNLTFHKEFFFRTSIFAIDAGTAICISFFTHSVYSLVWGLLAGSILELLISFIYIKPIPRFSLEKKYLTEIFNKGKWITAYGILNYFSTIGDELVVGRIFGATNLGIYEMAAKISVQPGAEISDVVSRVVFPVYTKIMHDKKRLFLAFSKITFIVATCSVLVGITILALAKEIILLAFGNLWLPMLPVLQVLIIYGIINTLAGPSTALFLAVKKQKYITAITFLRFFILAITIYPLTQRYGMVGAAYSAVFSLIFDIPVIAFFTFRIFKAR
ncbi:MAG: lipopolysaccharide biosynthesis protein [bacterium]|nr:lipopolysaccharide biosynthesis protein [bacterium]